MKCKVLVVGVVPVDDHGVVLGEWLPLAEGGEVVQGQRVPRVNLDLKKRGRFCQL